MMLTMLCLPLQFTFSNLDMFLKKYTALITQDNLLAFVRFWAHLLRQQPQLVQNYFAKCGYVVPGRTYHPYV
jgi:hypothetical protein